MKPPLSECMIAPFSRVEQHPLGDVLIPAGAGKAALIYAATLDRYRTWFKDGKVVFGQPVVDGDFKNPPAPAALRACATILRNPARYRLGAGPVHAITDLEEGQTLAEVVQAVRELRTGLAKGADVTIGSYPFSHDPSDPAWADAAAVTSALVWNMYPWNNVGLGGLEAWLAEIDRAEGLLKKWFPRRRRWIGFVTPTFQIYWQDQAQYAGILHLDGQPVPLEWWRAVLTRLRDGGWETCCWGFQPVDLVGGHLDAFREVFGLAAA